MITRRSLFGLVLLPVLPKLPTPVAEQFGQIMAQPFPDEFRITLEPCRPGLWANAHLGPAERVTHARWIAGEFEKDVELREIDYFIFPSVP